jgi:hypothetical protein
MVIAIERNHWPKEWRYMIRIEEIGKSPMLHIAILDRGTLNPQEIYTHIRPVEVTFTDGDVAFFFDEFERPRRVTIIQLGKPGFHETVRMVQPPQIQLSPRMKLQDIESHRLFTAEMLPSYTDNLSEEREPEPTLKSLIKWGPRPFPRETIHPRGQGALRKASTRNRRNGKAAKYDKHGGRQTETPPWGRKHGGYPEKKAVPREADGATENPD